MGPFRTAVAGEPAPLPKPEPTTLPYAAGCGVAMPGRAGAAAGALRGLTISNNSSAISAPRTVNRSTIVRKMPKCRQARHRQHQAQERVRQCLGNTAGKLAPGWPVPGRRSSP